MRSPRILFIQYTNPAAYPPLEHVSHILAREGCEALFLGTHAFGANQLSFAERERIKVKQMAFAAPGWRQKLHYLRFSGWVMFWALSWRPQWIYASDMLSCPVAFLLSFLPWMRVIYHEHDSPAAGGSRFHRASLAIRRRLAHRARINILPNEKRAELFAREMGEIKNVACVWNCPTLEEIASAKAGEAQKDLWVLYHGSIGSTKIPLTVIKSLALLPENIKLRIIGYETIGERGYLATLKKTAADHGVESRVDFRNAMPRHELLRWCNKADVGLALMPKSSDNVNELSMTGASNKPFDYLSSGLAVLISDLPDWRAMFVDPGYGLACDVDDPASIASALDWFFQHPAEMRQMGEDGRRRIGQEWNYEQQFMPILKQLGFPHSEQQYAQS